MRWIAAATVAVVVAAAVAAVGVAAAATVVDEPFTPGQGYTSGQAAALVVAYSSARIGFNVADASAQYQDGTATATGAALDSGFTTLLSELQTCGAYAFPSALVPPTTGVSTNDNHNAGPVAADNSSASTAPLATVDVSAAPNADGRATARSVDESFSGLVSINGGDVEMQAQTRPAAETRTATAHVQDGSVSLLGGLITLNGLDWDASIGVNGADSRSDHRTISRAFSIKSISVAGVTVRFPDVSSYASQLATVDKLIAPLGVQIRLPSIDQSTTGGVSMASVGPLTVALGGASVAGPLLDALLGGATLPRIESALKPGVFDPTTCTELGGLLEPVKSINADWNLLGSGYPIIVGAVVASLDGGGEVDVNIGGVTASVDDTYYPPASFGAPAFVTSEGAQPPSPSPSAAVHEVTVPPSAALSLPATPGTLIYTRHATVCRTTSPAGSPMCWGGHAVVAGLGAGVITLGLLAADERVRRRRRRA